MSRRASFALATALVLALAACQNPAASPTASQTNSGKQTSAPAAGSPSPTTTSTGSVGDGGRPSPSASGAPSPLPPAGLPAQRTITAIAGTVTAPAFLVAGGGVGLIGADGASLVAAGAGNIVAAGAGNIVAAGAGNIVAAGAGNLVAAGAGNYRLRQAGAAAAFRPVARARVYLTLGDVVLPIAPVETDDEGNYTFPKVPSGVTYQVVVSIVTPEGKTGRMASLVRPEATGAVANVSPVTTMVCAATVGTKKGLGDVDPASFRAATDALGALIATQSGADIDLADPTSLPGKVDALAAKDQGAAAAIGVVKAAAATAAVDAAEVSQLIQDLKVSTCAVGDVLAAPEVGAAEAAALPGAPSAIAVDADETVYLGDRDRRRVAVVKAGKVDRTIDGVEPLAIAVAAGAVYVGDAETGHVLRVAADGTRTEIAADQRYEPTAIAVAADGTAYFADAMRHAIFAVPAAGGAPTLLVGGRPGYADGAGEAARLYRPSGLALVGDALYVADAGNRRIRRVTLGGAPAIAAFAGTGAAGSLDGAVGEARFGYPAAIAADGTGTLWVADAAAGTIRRITTGGVVETVLDGGCVLDAKGLSYHGGLAFARTALYVLDGDRVVRRPVGPQPTPAASPTPSASPSPAASPAPSASPSPDASPSPSPSASTGA